MRDSEIYKTPGCVNLSFLSSPAYLQASCYYRVKYVWLSLKGSLPLLNCTFFIHCVAFSVNAGKRQLSVNL